MTTKTNQDSSEGGGILDFLAAQRAKIEQAEAQQQQKAAGRKAGRRHDPMEARKLARKLEKRMLREMNRVHAFIQNKRKPAHLTTDEDGFLVVDLADKEGLRDLYANRPHFVPEIKRDKEGREYVDGWKKLNRFAAWLENRKRRDVADIVNYPLKWGENLPNPHVLNVWPGYGLQPWQSEVERVGGDGLDADWPVACRLWLQHTLEVICCGNRDVFGWVLAWLAQMVQEPLTLPGSFLVLYGGQGTGKGTFMLAISKILGPSFLQIAQKRHLVGNFNTLLQGRLLIYANEIFVLDPEAKNVLKHNITEAKITIEGKFQRAYEIRNTGRVVMDTNEDHAIAAERDDRRAMVLEVSNHRAVKRDDDSPENEANKAYFQDLYAEINGHGPAALFHYLLEYDWTRFNLRSPPTTPALAAQKLKSLKPMEAWWYERLAEGVLFGADEDGDHARWPQEITLTRLWASFDAYANRMRIGEHRRPSRIDLRNWLTDDQRNPAKLRSSERRDGKVNEQGKRDWFLLVPDLDKARADFARWLGCPTEFIPWDGCQSYDGCSDDDPVSVLDEIEGQRIDLDAASADIPF